MDMKQKNELERIRRLDKVRTGQKNHVMLMLLALISIGTGFVYPLFSFMKWLGFILFGAAGSDLLRLKREVPFPYDTKALIETIKQQLPQVTLPSFVWDDPTYVFATQLKQICDQFYEIEHQSAQLQKYISQRNHEEEAVKQLNKVLGEQETDDIIKTYKQIQNKLKACRERAAHLENQQEKYRENQKRSEDLKLKLDGAREEREKMALPFLELGEGNLEEGIQIFKKNTEINHFIKVYDEEMLGHIDLVEAFHRYKTPEAVNAQHIEMLEQANLKQEEALRKAYVDKKQCENKIEQIKKENNLDDINGNILLLKDTREQYLKKRDTLMLLKSILMHADEVYRKEHQPDILKRVSTLMRIMTEGKYENVFISEGFELQFLIEGNLYPISRAFSKGTLNQLFLAYRLAVIEMLSEGRESLPIVLDEAFINWDDERLSQTYRILEEMSMHHQIFIFTCHPISSEIKAHHKINLSEWENQNVVE